MRSLRLSRAEGWIGRGRPGLVLEGLRELGGAADLEDSDFQGGSPSSEISASAGGMKGGGYASLVASALQEQRNALLRALPDLSVGDLRARALRAAMQPEQAAREIGRFAWVAERRTPPRWRRSTITRAAEAASVGKVKGKYEDEDRPNGGREHEHSRGSQVGIGSSDRLHRRQEEGLAASAELSVPPPAGVLALLGSGLFA